MNGFDLRQHEWLFWAGIVVVIVGVALLWALNASPESLPEAAIETATVQQRVTSPSIVVMPTATPGAEGMSPIATATPAADLPPVTREAPDSVTPPAGGTVYRLTPAAEAVGWARQEDGTANHFGDYNIYAGTFDGQTYVGAMQFDLTSVISGTEIVYADLTLTGLSDRNLRDEGTWQVELLEWWMDAGWQEKGYFGLTRGDGATLTLATLRRDDVAVGRANTVVLPPEALALLEARAYAGRVSFRVIGPADDQTLFSWDSGYGTGSRGQGPILRLVTEPAPATRPPAPTPRYTFVTATPTPGNLQTAVPIAQTATARATTTGTPTPVPPNQVVPIVVTNTPTPASAATAIFVAAEATAAAFLYGTPTPAPPYVMTATPTTEPDEPVYWIVTSTPTPEHVQTAVAIAVAATVRAEQVGTPTPLPANWRMVTPAIVTNTPTPENAATATFTAREAEAAATLYGTPTPVPPNVWTATPAPVLVPLDRLTPRPTPTPTPTPPGPDVIPAGLKGKIAFYSDRLSGSVEEPDLFVMDPDGSNVALLNDARIYAAAAAREARSPDGQYEAFVYQQSGRAPQIFIRRLADGALQQLTQMAGQHSNLVYDPAYSPDGDRIAFVSTAPGNDEIYVIDADGSDLTRLTDNTWEWDKHPTWSPAGTQLAFTSNRGSGRLQIWVMDDEGRNVRNLSNNEYNEWGPVWIK